MAQHAAIGEKARDDDVTGRTVPEVPAPPVTSSRPSLPGSSARDRWAALAQPLPATLTRLDWDRLAAQAPGLPTFAALADADTQIEGAEPVRAWCARHVPLTTLTAMLRNPHALAEIAQWKVTFGADLTGAVHPHMLTGTPLDGVPLRPTALERRWARAGSAWFTPGGAPSRERVGHGPGLAGYRVAHAKPGVLESAHILGADTPDDPFDDPFDDSPDRVYQPEDDQVGEGLLGLSGHAWLTRQLVIAVQGSMTDAAATLGAWLGRPARVRPGARHAVLGAALHALTGESGPCAADALTVRVAALDLLGTLPSGTPGQADKARWAHVRVGAVPTGARPGPSASEPGSAPSSCAFALEDPRSGRAWAASFAW